jgi:predicted GNAT superfamily acetyltransferase
MNRIVIRIIEDPAEMTAIEDLQRQVWPGNETEIVPNHLLLTAAHNGGMVLGAYDLSQASESETELPEDFWPGAGGEAAASPLVGFAFGFPGLYDTPDGPRLKHCSHMLGVLPEYRDQGVGFRLKRAQWQLVRRQGLDRITWTYDPLLSRNAQLNIARLGAVCNTYLREAYGVMRDGLNAGLPSDRFQVDWWVNSSRVERRLSRRARKPLDLAHFLAAETQILNPSLPGAAGLPRPAEALDLSLLRRPPGEDAAALFLVEIPPDFNALRLADPALALAWRLHSREIFEALFENGYLVTDFIYTPGDPARSFYVVSYGEASLM